jgi:hypothetical protein
MGVFFVEAEEEFHSCCHPTVLHYLCALEICRLLARKTSMVSLDRLSLNASRL